ncbi:MAG: 4-hydroxy-3-methylbut-2-en-yl diphosphate reductase, partial [Frankiaceae bacterium]|nr:4-hydroxy-3-methylbut-2-en-yl diphosphate reductase [Frankiaceae bacterium]
RGAVFVEELDEVPPGATVVFSAHGVSPAVHAEASERGLKTIDATCPLVTKVHHEAKRFAGDDYDILLIGHAGHEEVEGTSGEAPDHIQLVQGPDDVPNIVVRDPSKVAWLSQTTLSVDETLETVDAIRKRFPELLDPPSDDICYATQNRQLAVKEIAHDADLVIVVGSANSSNSVRLAEVALEAGAKAAHRVDDASEIDPAWFDGVDEAAAVPVRDETRVAWLSQTTLSVDETMTTVAALRERFPALMDPPSDDICYATQNRQLAVKQMALSCDLVLVVGSTNSSNSVRLVEVALDAGARAAYLVDYAAEVQEAWLDGVTTVGVTSGASVPEVLVHDLLTWLAERGFGAVEEVEAAEERLVFALPHELRRDLRA